MNEQKKPNKTYTSEFKESAVKLANEADQPVSQTARELDVNVNTYTPGSANIPNR